MTDKILFMSIDDLRFDCVGFQPDKQELNDRDVLKLLSTPMLDSIAEKSLCFTQCISTNSYTTASHASILTGRYPPRHGVRAFFQKKLSPQAISLAEILKENGYRTILFTDSTISFVPIELSRGFDSVLVMDENVLFRTLEQLREEKVFIFAHFLDVHEPYLHNTNDFRPGSNEDYLQELSYMYQRHGIFDQFDRSRNRIELWHQLVNGALSSRPVEELFSLYIKGVSKFDAGRLANFMKQLAGTGFLDGALTAIFSDHGEGRCFFNDSDFLGHSGELYENVVRVPLMLSHPDLKPGIDNSLMSTVDIMPTVLSLVDVEKAAGGDGIDILSDSRTECYAECWSHNWSSQLEFETNLDLEGSVKPDIIQSPEFMLTQMALRTDSNMYFSWNTGPLDKISSRDFDGLSNSDFVKKLHEIILARVADPYSLELNVKALAENQKNRQELFDIFMNSNECEYKKDTRYDLMDDPQESVPLHDFNDDDLGCFRLLKEISSQSVAAEDIFPRAELAQLSAEGQNRASEEERKTMEQLRDLGYF